MLSPLQPQLIPSQPLALPTTFTHAAPVTLVRSEGHLVYDANLLLPHRRTEYMLLLVRQSGNRHWLDTVPYVQQPGALYFAAPGQVMVKEEPQPFWGTYLAFTDEFLALQPNTTLRELPLLQNPEQGHE
ncbi:MAG: hypothetical protein M3Y54_00660, partial [Bacteroidota bacterium]|nr:hypothetical protein [Bacteroidota bacterium]